MGTADLHIHSTYSHNATTTVRAIQKHASDYLPLAKIARFGYVFDSSSASQPIDTQRYTQIFIRKVKKK